MPLILTLIQQGKDSIHYPSPIKENRKVFV